MKKVLMILTEFPPAIGGMQTHAILISRMMHERGSKVVVYTYREMDNSKLATKIDNSFDFPIKRKLTRIGYQKNLNTLVKAACEFKPDLIYSSTVFYGILEEITNIPVICRSVGNDIMRPWIAYPFKIGSTVFSSYLIEKYLYRIFKKISKPEMVEIIFRKKRYELTCRSAQAASIIFANSRFTEALLDEAGVKKEKVKRVVGGVDSSFFEKKNGMIKSTDRSMNDSMNNSINKIREEFNIPEKRKILLTACRLVDKKGVDFLINSMVHFKNNGDKFHLLIVGDGRRRKRLMRMAEELSVNDRVSFIGSVSYEEMPQYYWSSDIFVLASTVFVDKKTGLKDAETMGRVLCEANASGIPVIATESGGIPSVIEHEKNGLLFQENDMEGFLRNIERINKEPETAENLIHNGVKISRDIFDWKRVIEIHEKEFDRYISLGI